LKRRRITPAIAAAVAGRLDDPSYRWYDRAMIRLIMRITGGPTDPRTTIEYTDWQQVDSIADAIAALALGTRA
jgi:menaquinone-dependent protoporphyrinogen oxidase